MTDTYLRAVYLLCFMEEHGLGDLMKVVRGVPQLSTPYVPRNSLVREFVGGSIYSY